MMCRELAKSLDLELYCCAENGMKRYPMPDIIIDFPAGAVALDDNYISETKEENLYRIPSENYVGIDDNGYELKLLLDLTLILDINFPFCNLKYWD